jgi:CheY-like chemotaxis protein
MTACIRDSGIGIRQEDMDKLFVDYAMVDTKANKRIEGTGLGLPIAKKMVEMMDGSISVESEYGKGSTFTIKIKQGYVDDAVIGTKVAENLRKFSYADQKHRQNGKLTRISLPYARVLVVDDVQTNLDVARGLLKPYGMQIDATISGQQAIDAIRNEQVMYNAVFMDHMMPGMDGIEAAQKIREIGTDYAKNIPIIALTANAIVGNEQMFLSKGFQAFLTKPIELPRLDAVIHHWIRDREKEKLIVTAEKQTADVPAGKTPPGVLSFRIDGIDLQKGLEIFGNDEESYLSVLRTYAANTPSWLDELRKASKDTLPGYYVTIHGIKGASYGICAQAIGEKAKTLETAASEGNFDFVRENNGEFIAIAEKFLVDINEMLSVIDAGTSKPKKKSPDKDALTRLLEACKARDMDGMDEAAAELDKFEYAAGGELVSWLWENVQKCNFTEIIDKLSG